MGNINIPWSLGPSVHKDTVEVRVFFAPGKLASHCFSDVFDNVIAGVCKEFVLGMV